MTLYIRLFAVLTAVVGLVVVLRAVQTGHMAFGSRYPRPTFDRADDPLGFWSAVVTSVVVSALAVFLILRVADAFNEAPPQAQHDRPEPEKPE